MKLESNPIQQLLKYIWDSSLSLETRVERLETTLDMIYSQLDDVKDKIGEFQGILLEVDDGLLE